MTVDDEGRRTNHGSRVTGHESRVRWRVLRLIFAFCLVSQAEAVAFAAPPAAAADFSGWHLPLPAGKWTISRGPCGSAARYNHPCGYYEDQCGVDFIPVSGSMENVPVLAPQAGRVFFLGTRADAGLAVMLRHADGRLSALMHLSKIVVGLDQFVAQGEVIGYAGGTGNVSNPHLHFHVQQNAVERSCLDLKGLDDLDYLRMTATSRNLAWTELTLPDPPAALPDWLTLEPSPKPGESVVLPAQLLVAPGAETYLPVAVTSADPTETLMTEGVIVQPARRTPSQALFDIVFFAPEKTGDYEKTLQPVAGVRLGAEVTLPYSVRPAPDTQPGLGLMLINPAFGSPSNWSTLRLPPRLCWWEDPPAGENLLHFRVLVVGPTSLDSGWITGLCWQTQNLQAGTYFWKVFVRDANGYMNRTNQRPQAFTIDS